MGQYLHQQGFTVSAPLLAGHGTTPEDLQQTNWQDWWMSVKEAFIQLRETDVEQIAVVGHSMGGILSLLLVSEYPDELSSVVTMCAPIIVRDFRANFAGLLHWFKPYALRGSEKHPMIEQHLVPYERTPLKSVSELNRLIRHVRKRLSQIQLPALVIQSVKDETVMPRSGELIYEQLSSKDKTLSWYENSTHIITLDRERRKLFQEVEQFLLRTSVERV
jgi:carboxylesterase